MSLTRTRRVTGRPGWIGVALAAALATSVVALPTTGAAAATGGWYWTGSLAIDVETSYTPAQSPTLFGGQSLERLHLEGTLATPVPHPRETDPPYPSAPASVFTVTDLLWSSRNEAYGGTDSYTCGGEFSGTLPPVVGQPSSDDLDVRVRTTGLDGSPTAEALLHPIRTASGDRTVTAEGIYTYLCRPGDQVVIPPATRSIPITFDELMICDAGQPEFTPWDEVGLGSPQPGPGGTITLQGTVTRSCPNVFRTFDRPPAGDVQTHVQTFTYDLVGTPAPAVPDPVTLTVTTERKGKVVGLDGQIDCGDGGTKCRATVERGTVVRLAALTAQYTELGYFRGCDGNTALNPCLVTMTGDKVVTATFVLDTDALYPPEPPTLLSLDRKIEVAGNGADYAREGSRGCAITAGLLGLAQSGVVAIGTGAGVVTRYEAFLTKLIEEGIGGCAEGLAGTIYNGLLLKVDPPDPDWRSVALPQRFPVDAAPRCGFLRTCAALRRAWAGHARAHGRVTELREAVAVAANRYGNAVNAGDTTARRLHRATWRALGGMLADAARAEAKAGTALAAALRKAGIRSVTMSRAGTAKATSIVAAGRAIPAFALTRPLARHLVTSKAAALADIRSQARRVKPQPVEVLRALSTPERTTVVRRDAAALRLPDLQLVLTQLHSDRATPATARDRQLALLDTAWRCDSGTPWPPTPAPPPGAWAPRPGSFIATLLSARGTNAGPGCGV